MAAAAAAASSSSSSSSSSQSSVTVFLDAAEPLFNALPSQLTCNPTVIDTDRDKKVVKLAVGRVYAALNRHRECSESDLARATRLWNWSFDDLNVVHDQSQQTLSDDKKFYRGTQIPAPRDALDKVIPFIMGLSYTDMGFMALCKHWQQRPPAHMAQMMPGGEDDDCGIQWLLETRAMISVYLSQHTREARRYWPSPTEWAEFKWRVARVVTTFLATGPEFRVELNLLIDKSRVEWQVDKNVQQGGGEDEVASSSSSSAAAAAASSASEVATPKHKTPTPHGAIMLRRTSPQLVQMYQARHCPPELHAQLERAIALARSRRAMEDDDDEGGEGESDAPVDDLVSEEASGTLWRNSTDELTHNYVRLAARLVRRIEFDHAFAATYAMRADTVPLPVLSGQVRNRLIKWVREKTARPTHTDEFMKLFRDLAVNMCLPMGSDRHHCRNRETHTSMPTPQMQLMDELGLHLGAYVQDPLRVHVSDIGKLGPDNTTPAGMHWSALSVALFQHTCMHRLGLDWIKFYFYPARRMMQESWRFEQALFMQRAKCPIVVETRGGWGIFNKQQLMQPTYANVEDAVQPWLHVMRTEYNCKTEDGTDITEMYNLFQDSMSVVVR